MSGAPIDPRRFALLDQHTQPALDFLLADDGRELRNAALLVQRLREDATNAETLRAASLAGEQVSQGFMELMALGLVHATQALNARRLEEVGR